MSSDQTQLSRIVGVCMITDLRKRDGLHLEATTAMYNKANNSVETRIKSNSHFASTLRRRLESRNGNGALHETLARISDAELIEIYLNNERQGREYSATLRAEKGACQ